jgi:hypothetical protein
MQTGEAGGLGGGFKFELGARAFKTTTRAVIVAKMRGKDMGKVEGFKAFRTEKGISSMARRGFRREIFR